VVETLRETLEDAGVVVVAHNNGLTVADASDLRRKMREGGAGLKVTKNTLAQRAVEGTRYAGLAKLFRGPAAIAFSRDPVAAAKVAVEYAKRNEKFVVIGGGLGETTLDAAGVDNLSKLPPLESLRAKLVGLLQTPAQRLAVVMAAPAAQLARVCSAYGSKE
jgi:large subunit ribosomal protein L10